MKGHATAAAAAVQSRTMSAESSQSFVWYLALPAILSLSVITWVKCRGLEYVILHYRWIFVCLLLLPLSVVYDVFYFARSWAVFRLKTSPGQHRRKVGLVQSQILAWKADGCKTLMCTARPGWMNVCLRNALYKKTFCNIRVDLIDIIQIDIEHQVIRVEPLVTMGQISAILNPLGWTLPVLPELDDLTAGGLIMGVGIETSSHKHGLFQHCCVSFELVLADGRVVTCSEDENSDLFFSVPWSHGTLGFLVSAELKIVPAKKYLRVEYIPVYSAEDIVQKFEEETTKKTGNEFVEAIVYSASEAVIMTANMTDSPEDKKINSIGYFWKPWFFKHVEGFLKKGAATEYIPLRHYYHRHTRSIFWELQDIIPFGNHLIFRYLFGWMMPPKISLLKLTQGKTIKQLYEKYQIIQDMLVPMHELEESLKFFHNELNLYPLWLCPFMLFNRPGMVHPRGVEDEMYVDIGAYGPPKSKMFKSITSIQRLESYVRKVKGFQMLYADSYLTREEFREMFDHALYDRMRVKLNCTNAFPEVYDKVNRKARY